MGAWFAVVPVIGPMGAWALVGLFLASLGLSLVSSGVLSGGVDRLGARLCLPEELIGLVTALAALGQGLSRWTGAVVIGLYLVFVGVVLTAP
jgi:hypothetical protein